jgi:flagellar FliL protein
MAEEKSKPADAAAPSRSGGMKAWLPLVATLLAMPILAYGTMNFLILPKLKKQLGTASETEEYSEASAATHAEGSPEDETGKTSGGRKGRQTVTLNKMIVNVAGTMGTRYLMASITVVGSGSNFKRLIEENRDQLLDLANSTLASKTIADLEKPGAKNQIKTELISVFNNALGESVVKEIYLPEMAIQ